MNTLTRPIEDIKKELHAILVSDLPAAIQALRDLSPDNSILHKQALTLLTRLKELNNSKIMDENMTMAEYNRQLQIIHFDLFNILNMLQESDFEEADPNDLLDPNEPRQGSVLYRVPSSMPIEKPTICTIRVAIDKASIAEDMVLDEHIKLRHKVAITEMMKAELVDVSGGDAFDIRSLSSLDQRVRDTGYTQWLFSVTPRQEGKHQLVVKVSAMKFDEILQKHVPFEVTIIESVEILSEIPGETPETPFKPAGVEFPVGDAPAAAAGAPPAKSQSGMRNLAMMVMFVVLGASATYALTPAQTLDWWMTSLNGSATAYTEYIEKYKNSGAGNKHLEKAYYQKARQTNDPADWRAYLDQYPEGQFSNEIKEKLQQLEQPAPSNTSVPDKPAPEKVETPSKPAEQPVTATQKPAPVAPADPKPAVPETQPANTAPATNTATDPPVPSKPRRSGLEMVRVAGGSFTMGNDAVSGDDKDQKPAHSVTVASFFIGKYEVTQADWREIMGQDPSKLTFKGCDDCPVEGVTWYQTQEFIKKLNAKTGLQYRLPTEAEWEFAARGGARSKHFSHAGCNTPTNAGWIDSNSGQKTHPVGEKKANELGLFDMGGNVWEWCADWYAPDYYQSSPASNPTGPASGKIRVFRGGSFFNNAANSQPGYRNFIEPDYGGSALGFRVVR